MNFFGIGVNTHQREAFQLLKEMYPEAEPSFLKKLVKKYERRKELIIDDITAKLSTMPYPKKEPLNKRLLDLLEMFPRASAEFCREVLLKYGFEAIDVLLKNEYPQRLQLISDRDLFRDRNYVVGALTMLMNDYPYVRESTIKAIMAENNNDYPTCHEKLKLVKVGSFWKSLPFTKRQPILRPELDNEQLQIELKSMNVPSTGNDFELAATLNQQEYEAESQLIECSCCFGDVTFEDMVACTNSHLFCKTCIIQSVSIGMYDSGTVRGKRLKCMSSDSTCDGYFTMETLKFLPTDLYMNYEASLFEQEAKSAGLVIVSCPSCNYFEESPPEFKYTQLYQTIQYFCNNSIEMLRRLSLVLLVLVFLTSSSLLDTFYWITMTVFILKRLINLQEIELYFTKLGQKFKIPKNTLNCKNPKCLKSTCIECKKEWNGAHICFEEEKDSKRIHIEMAMSRALIRTCVNCNISFSKIDGCNKMTCPMCGYVMCYICRQDIKSEGYNHFCQHFRVVPGSKCTTCSKCDLYQKEADAEVVRAAAASAEREWIQSHPEENAKLQGTRSEPSR